MSRKGFIMDGECCRSGSCSVVCSCHRVATTHRFEYCVRHPPQVEMLSAAPVRCPITLDEKPLCPQITPCGAWLHRMWGCVARLAGLHCPACNLAPWLVAVLCLKLAVCAWLGLHGRGVGTLLVQPLLHTLLATRLNACFTCVAMPHCRPRLLLPSHHWPPGGARRPRAAQERPLPALLHAGK